MRYRLGYVTEEELEMGIYKRMDSPYWWMKFKVDGKQFGPMSTSFLKVFSKIDA